MHLSCTAAIGAWTPFGDPSKAPEAQWTAALLAVGDGAHASALALEKVTQDGNLRANGAVGRGWWQPSDCAVRLSSPSASRRPWW